MSLSVSAPISEPFSKMAVLCFVVLANFFLLSAAQNGGGYWNNNNGNVDNTVTVLSPCECSWGAYQCGCDCTGVLTYDDMMDLMTQFRTCLRFYFRLSQGSFYSLPPNFFSKIGKVKEFVLDISDCNVEYFLDPEKDTSAFRGVSFEDGATIKLSNVRTVRGWNWAPLKELMSLSGKGVDIRVSGCGVRRLSSDFNRIASGSVDDVEISNSDLEMLGSGSFASFDNITHLLLPENKLKAIARNVLPKTASKLVEIDLRQNDLSILESDVFTGMPALKKVSLRGNPIRVMGEAAFKPILETVVVDGISSFPLVCDCRMQWLKDLPPEEYRKVEKNLGSVVCKRPPHLRGKPLRDLAVEHLICPKEEA